MLSFYCRIVRAERLWLNTNYPYVWLDNKFHISPRLVSKTRLFLCLQTVSENARLELNPSNCGHGGSAGGGSVGVGATSVNNNVADDDFELWDQSGFMLRHDVDDPLTSGKSVFNSISDRVVKKIFQEFYNLVGRFVGKTDGEVRKDGANRVASRSRSY